MSPYLEGMATVDELYFPTRKRAGLTLRTFDREKAVVDLLGEQRHRAADPTPVVSGFDGYHGEFYSNDNLDGQPIKVRTNGGSRTIITHAGSRPTRSTTRPGRPIGPPTSLEPTHR